MFPRRPIEGEDGKTFRIRPQRPVAELRAEALAATPPAESGLKRESDLVDLATLDPTIRFDIRYASSNNFLGTPMYQQARAFLQRPAAEALLRAHQALGRRGLGLLMEAEGFRVYEAEWWHFDYQDWRLYPIGNLTFEQIGSGTK